MPAAGLLQRSDIRRYLFGQGLSFVGDTAMSPRDLGQGTHRADIGRGVRVRGGW
jgi:hypothetical protein